MKRITINVTDEQAQRARKIAQKEGYKLSFAYGLLFELGIDRVEQLEKSEQNLKTTKP